MKLSNRVLEMEESVTLAANARAKALAAEGRDILSLTLGEPDFATPKNIQEAAVASIEDGRASFYTVASGLPELKDAISDYMKEFYGYAVNRNEVVVGTGAKFILYAFFATVINPGDEVIIPTPCWVSYVDQVKMVEGVPVTFQTTEANHFKATVEQLEAARTEKTKVVLLNSPSNPTGMIYSKEELTAIGDWAVAHDLLILADDIYHRLVYNGAEFTAISSLSDEIRKRTTVINGVSKTFAMTGWRIGWIAAPEDLMAQIVKLHQYNTICAPIMSQYAALEGLKHGWNEVEKMRISYKQRRNLMYKAFCDMGLSVPEPTGAFYMFPDISATGLSSEEFAMRLFKKHNVAVVPGSAFGKAGEGHIRCCYATSVEKIKIALAKIDEMVRELRKD